MTLTFNKKYQMRPEQIYRHYANIYIAFFVLCSSLYSQESEESRPDLKDEFTQSIFITANTGGSNDMYILDLIAKDAKNFREPYLLILGNSVQKKGFDKHAKDSLTTKELTQISEFNDKAIFTPGNNEWATHGQKGVADLERFIEKSSEAKFYPGNGSPISKKNLNENTVMITIDSQWYLENWNKNGYINADSEIESRALFFFEFEHLLKKAEDKIKIIAIHHPILTNSRQGLLANIGGISKQDFQNQQYRSLRRRLMTLARQSDNIIFVSGHDKNLQYLNKNGISQIISGAANGTHNVKNGGEGEFTSAENGYARLDIHTGGKVSVHYYKSQGARSIPIFSTTILKPEKQKIPFDFQLKKDFQTIKMDAIYSKKEITKSGFYKGLWGQHYRKFYGTEVKAPVVFLDTLFGGLQVKKSGGGQQSRSLRLADRDGREYVMRALRKSTTQFIQANAFQEVYIGNALEGTAIDKSLLDFYTTANPYTPFAIGTLSEAVGIYHTNPSLFYVPKQKLLGGFNEEFGDELYMIEEHVGDTQTGLKSFGSPKKILSTTDVLEEILKNGKSVVDEPSYIRARLFDMLIGDWDRHEDQWRWALFKNKDGTEYCKPIPRDRDQAFSRYDGALIAFLTRAVPGLRKMQSFDEELRSPKWFATSPYNLDITLIKNSDWGEWEKQASYLQKNLTDAEIERAFQVIPKEVQGESIEGIKKKLKGRRANIVAIAKEYFDYLNRFEVLVGTQKDDKFEIIRGKNGKTTIEIHRKDLEIFNRTFTKEVTKEIWIYGLDGQDTFTASGTGNNLIKIKVLGGMKNDTYDLDNPKKIKLYDYATKPNTIVNKKSKKWLVDDYDINSYDHKKVKHNTNQILPILGFNPDDGLRIGAIDHYTYYGIQSNPFTQKHSFSASYYTSTSGYDFAYNGEFSNLFHNWNFGVEGLYTSPNFARNFFGFGNDTSYDKDLVDLDFNRVRIRKWNAAIALIYRGRDGGSFEIKPLLESFDVENTAGRFINGSLANSTFFDRQTYGGAEIAYQFVNRNHSAFPTLGLDFGIRAGYKSNIDGGSGENNFTYVIPHLAIDHKLSKNGAIVLATKIGGEAILGNDFEFYHAAVLGGNIGLRGFRNERFSGNYSFYQNTDVRLVLGRLKTSIIPLQYGLTASFDYGRVWLENDISDKWHNSTGGSLWLNGLGAVTANLGYYDSSDGGRIVFAMGFAF